MRQPLQDTRRFTQTATVVSTPSPVGGWNTADSLATMPPLDAIIMDNWIPEESGVMLRGGDSLFAEGMSGDVKTLDEYVSPTETQLLAASDGNLYNITAGGASPVLIGSGFGTSIWQTTNQNAHMFFANGTDTVQDWNGTTLAAAGFTGVDLTTLINVNTVRDRVWFTRKDTAEAWYGPLEGVTGALTLFNIGEVARSGFLVQVASWSRDAGNGMDDFTVFIMSTGQILVYQGDPASTFATVGSFNAPKPIGFRSSINMGGELVILTEGGYFTLTNIMEGATRPQDALSAKIRTAVSDAFNVGGTLDGWDVMLTPDQRKIIVNVPVTNLTTYTQHVFNTITKGWGRWLDRNTLSMSQFNADIYGGFTGGKVFKLESGKTDASRTNANIVGYVVQAFNSYEEVTQRNKLVTMIKPFVQGTGDVTISVGVWADYDVGVLQENLQVLNPSALSWQEYTDVLWETWDLLWGSDSAGISSINLSANRRGDTFANAIAVNTDQSVSWFSTNLTIKPGGIT